MNTNEPLLHMIFRGRRPPTAASNQLIAMSDQSCGGRVTSQANEQQLWAIRDSMEECTILGRQPCCIIYLLHYRPPPQKKEKELKGPSNTIPFDAGLFVTLDRSQLLFTKVVDCS